MKAYHLHFLPEHFLIKLFTANKFHFMEFVGMFVNL